MKIFKSYYLVIFAVFLSLTGIIMVNAMYLYQRDKIIAERDEQLFSLAYSVDNNMIQKLDNLSSDMDYTLQDKHLEELENGLTSEEGKAAFTEYFLNSHVFEMKDLEGIVIYDDVRQIYALNQNDASTDYSYTFLEDQDADNLYVCHDQYGKYSIALERKSPWSDYLYYVLVDLDHFYDAIVPEQLQRSNWIVFYEEECGLLLQNHDNQEPWMVLSDQEIEARNDGYTIIRKNQLADTMGAETYMYQNYYGKLVRERIITLPQKMTSNGYFSIGISRDSEELYKHLDFVRMITLLVVLVLLLSAVLVTSYILKSRQKALHTELEMNAKLNEKRLQDALEEAQLQNSIHQLQPHFLYNSLSSIREIVLEAPEYAADLLLDFTNFLRACLRAMTTKGLVPFDQELKNIEAYVNIEKMRLGDKLTVIYDIQEYDFDIIPLGIQPLVENAIRHGISKKRNKTGTIWIRTSKTDTYIEIVVEDNGIGFDMQQKKYELDHGLCDSTGLKNLVLRYRESMGATVDGSSIIGSGTKIWVRIPL